LALEKNSQLIRGKFILNIIKNAFSGAIVVLINVSLLYFFNKLGFANVTDEVFITMCVYVVLFTGYAMLYKMIQPVNIYRGALIVIMAFFIGMAISYARGFLGIVALTEITNILMVIVMAEAAFGLINFINSMLTKIKLSMEDKYNK
jgi:hypothetical protein